MTNKYLNIAVNEATKGVQKKHGGPFGAVIISKDGKIIAKAHNMVLKKNDPTAHAEITAIRKATKKIHTYDLSNYILYSNSEPCPMCLSAIIWANIKEVYYGVSRKDANAIGFRDAKIYKYFKEVNPQVVKLTQIDDEICKNKFKNYKDTLY